MLINPLLVLTELIETSSKSEYKVHPNLPASFKLQRRNMTRAHYIVRVGNAGLAATISETAPNHWHYLSPQHIWGFPKTMTTVKVRAAFEADVETPGVTAYIWFLCNGHGGPGHFVQAGIGARLVRNGPVGDGTGDGNRPIPAEMMGRLQAGFDHWFEWRPVSTNSTFQDRIRQLPVPHPPYIPALRRVTETHQSFPLFQDLIDVAEQQAAAAAAAAVITAVLPAATLPTTSPPIAEVELENIRREQTDPHSEGYVYLIRMEGTTFYKIGMSLDPEIRLQTLQTGNPYRLDLVNRRAVRDMRGAETGLHGRFERKRVPNVHVREWFNLDEGTAEVDGAFASLQ